MGRLLTKIIVLIPIGLVVAAIYRLEQRWTTAPEQGVVYIDSGMSARNPLPPAP
jgi:hypothetical protein